MACRVDADEVIRVAGVGEGIEIEDRAPAARQGQGTEGRTDEACAPVTNRLSGILPSTYVLRGDRNQDAEIDAILDGVKDLLLLHPVADIAK